MGWEVLVLAGAAALIIKLLNINDWPSILKRGLLNITAVEKA